MDERKMKGHKGEKKKLTLPNAKLVKCRAMVKER
jgi:hypothetical protein